jgi:hypothetical protein
MKTRRIYLQPGECAEVVNQYGTSMLKAIARFEGSAPCVVIYEQPDVLTVTAVEAKELDLSFGPVPDIALDLTEQNMLDIELLSS